jgi:hypothetical protein
MAALFTPAPLLAEGSFLRFVESKVTAREALGGAQFGHAVAMTADLALIGAPREKSATGEGAGAVYVFARNGKKWVQQGKLTAPNAEPGAHFGQSVALYKQTIVIGAPFQSGEGNMKRAGAVYVFKRRTKEGAWLPVATLKASDPQADDQFGATVAIGVDMIAVGSPNHKSSRGERSGTVSIFGLYSEKWLPDADLDAGEAKSGDGFGSSLALSGNRLLVGAAGLDPASTNKKNGYAVLFSRANLEWKKEARFSGADLQARTGREAPSGFGHAVALLGDVAIITAPGARNSLASQENAIGQAAVYRNRGSAWEFEAALSTPSSSSKSLFGTAISLNTITTKTRGTSYQAVIGEPFADYGNRETGALHFFKGTNGHWAEVSTFFGRDPGEADQLGWAVALNGNMVLTGAPADDTRTLGDSGSAYFVRFGK